VSQRAFLRDLATGEAYLAEGPSLWDVTFGTAVAQAELEDREVPGSYVRIAFGAESAADGPGEVLVATTRPELLPACVALVAHPDDERYAALLGRTVVTPLFEAAVPVLGHRLADPAKGTGIAMVCTFGDTTDVTWWRDLQLDTRPVIGRDGRLRGGPLPWLTTPAGQAAYQELAGMRVRAARARITDLLRESGDLRGEPEPVVHPVKFYEKGEAPLEIVSTRQWFIKNGGRDPALREALLARGRELDWRPPHMRARYEDWVNGLAGDWLVSRQRYFGVPIPLWYPLDEGGAPRHGAPILPADETLPVDPAADAPPGYEESQRGRPGGFAADPDVMDTWATSSLSPRIAAAEAGQDAAGQVFPMDLRPQGPEIIRTWLFYTVLRSHVQEGVLPWRHAAISGWILDPDRKKMSKSKGNVTTPAELLTEYGSDAVRYWAASARLGVDTAFEPGQLKIGRRLALKILNASRFVLGMSAEGDGPGGAADDVTRITEPLDLAMLGRLADVAQRCTEAFEAYDHALALELTERFFWFFCDDYLELVKPRAYGGSGEARAASAIAALRLALSVQLRLFAPIAAFVTEEAWSWWHDEPGAAGSVHRAPWPDPLPLRALAGRAVADGLLDAASAAIGSVRKAKSEARLPMRASVGRLVVTAPAAYLAALAPVLPDVQAAGAVAEVDLRAGPDGEPVHEITL
jgi:valyl-tRNA synthetase